MILRIIRRQRNRAVEIIRGIGHSPIRMRDPRQHMQCLACIRITLQDHAGRFGCLRPSPVCKQLLRPHQRLFHFRVRHRRPQRTRRYRGDIESDADAWPVAGKRHGAMIEIRWEQVHAPGDRFQVLDRHWLVFLQVLGCTAKLDPAGVFPVAVLFRDLHVINATQPCGGMYVRKLVPLPIENRHPCAQTPVFRFVGQERVIGIVRNLRDVLCHRRANQFFQVRDRTFWLYQQFAALPAFLG